MGGYGSGRWGWHSAKRTVESSLRLEINNYAKTLSDLAKHDPADTFTGNADLSWTNQRGERLGAVHLRLDGNPNKINAWLEYTVVTNGDTKEDYHYRIGLTYTLAPWGARRYWWTCPKCGERCGVLYLPPGAYMFACRRCHYLTYQKCLESHKSNRYIDQLFAAAGVDMTGAEFDAILDWEAKGRKGKPPKALRARIARLWAEEEQELEREEQERLEWIRARQEAEAAAKAAKYDRYLSPAQLCERSGLSPENLAALAAARLLLPDREGKYRPKLEGWARKLAYLLGAGWDIESIRRWSAERWHSPNPRAWPPDSR